MTVRQLIRLLFPALMVVGLALSPFSAWAAEGAMGRDTMLAMAGDMGNCLSQQPVLPDCQKTCPLMTVCAVSWAASTASVESPVLALDLAGGTIRPGNDTFGGPFAEGPPSRPPRT